MRIILTCFLLAFPVFCAESIRFHLYSDLIFHSRGSITTFDTFHHLFIAELYEKNTFRFTLEINPNPRLFELQYRINKKLTVFGGKFLIPFNHSNPHMRYGGYVIVPENIGEKGKVLLPDIWSDLGLGIKYLFLEFASWYLKFTFYICNGFKNSEDNTGLYYSPDFSATGANDNNSDKAVGMSLGAYFNKLMRVGFSFYTNQYDHDHRLYIIGLDSKIIAIKNLDIETGYIFFHVRLPGGSTNSSFERGGFYVRINYNFMYGVYGELMAGISQTDSRILDEGDKTLLGTKIGYKTKIFDFSIIGLYDLKKVPTKSQYGYLGLKASIKI